MILGTFVHEILEELYKLDPENRTIPEARRVARELWENKFAKETSTVRIKSVNDFRWQAWWCIENVFGMEKPPNVKIRGIEDKFSASINDVPLLGFIDRWTEEEDGSLTVTDYKSGKVSKPQYEGDKVFQIVLYVEMLERLNDLEISNAEIMYVKFKERKRYVPTPKRRNTVLKIINQTWDGVTSGCQTGQFAPQTGPLCNWCAYKNICPAWN
tara:strand:+ start:10520 stop:11158 length:639 start_codon:yes stop_codon:yes gene_type:complete